MLGIYVDQCRWYPKHIATKYTWRARMLHLYKMAFHFSCISPEINGLIANIISALNKQQKLGKICASEF